MKFVITTSEIIAMRNAGCSFLARLAYIEAIRPHMDTATRIVGITSPISYRSIREDIYAEPIRGRHTDKSGSPTIKAIRSAIENIIEAGLLEKRTAESSLVFFLPFATLSHLGHEMTNRSKNAIIFNHG